MTACEACSNGMFISRLRDFTSMKQAVLLITSFALLTINNTVDESLFTGSQPLAISPTNMWATIENPNIVIKPSSSDTMRVRLNVAKDAKPGTYQYAMSVTRVATNEKIEKT